MEYRTTHGKVLAKLEKKKHEKERKKTKGKFIVSTVCILLSRAHVIPYHTCGTFVWVYQLAQLRLYLLQDW